MYEQISWSFYDMEILQHQHRNPFRFLLQTENSATVFRNLLCQVLSPWNWEAAFSWYKNKKALTKLRSQIK